MTFNEIAEKLKTINVAAKRESWNDDKRLAWDKGRALFMLKEGIDEHIWYWDSPEEFQTAAEDLGARDWQLMYS